MSKRNASTFSKHRKDNYSLDIKGIYTSGANYTPYAKKKPEIGKLFARLKTQMLHNTSMQSPNKETAGNKRRFSLTKSIKTNHTFDLQLEKVRKVQKLIEEQKFEVALPILHRFIIQQQNNVVKQKLYWFNAICLKSLGKFKQAEQFLTRYLNEDHRACSVLIERGIIRYHLGAKELGIRDLNQARYLQPVNAQAYIQLCKLYIESGENKEAFKVVIEALRKDISSAQILTIGIELLLSDQSQGLKDHDAAESLIKKLKHHISTAKKNSAEVMYLEALLYESNGESNEACIFYEQCLKFNNSPDSVTKSLERLILIKIHERDYYSAYHTVSRAKALGIKKGYIEPYATFLEGVIMVMKKKFVEGIRLLESIIESIENSNAQLAPSIRLHRKCRETLQPLLYKFNAYSYFKIGRHDKCISNYQKLEPWGYDECSSYNLLLVEGIVCIEKMKNFQLGIEKFEQAKYIYPNRVEPSIYISMTVIYRDLCVNNKVSMDSSTLTSAVVHALEELNDAHETVNSSSSNLLFHRSILYLYLEDWENAQKDINLCIEKAEENEPKYFYLRGLSYAVNKQLKKAINEYSISLSLNSDYHSSLLERSKCYFLLGQTENGFADLKLYMHKKPNDYKVHKWIGDLLYEGKSYRDAIKAYEEIDEAVYFEAEVMKCKCLLRIGNFQGVNDCITKFSKLEECDENKVKMDILGVSLLKILSKPHEQKDILTKIKKLNAMLEENVVGHIFDLIDCMFLLGVATLYAGKFDESYQSFLLTLELFNTLNQKNHSDLKSDCSEENLSMALSNIYLNLVISQIGMKSFEQAVQMMKEEFLPAVESEEEAANVVKIVTKFKEEETCYDAFTLGSQPKTKQKIKLKHIDLRLKKMKIKCIPYFSLFHHNADDLYSRKLAQSMVKDLKPSYIDNMPEGPWIKRNEYGVIFTDNIIEDACTSTFLSSMRTNNQGQSSSERSCPNQTPNIELQKQRFKKNIALSKDIEKKLNCIIKNSDSSF